MADHHDTEPTQQTKPAKGEPMTIPIPTEREFDEFVRKVAGPPGGPAGMLVKH